MYGQGKPCSWLYCIASFYLAQPSISLTALPMTRTANPPKPYRKTLLLPPMHRLQHPENFPYSVIPSFFHSNHRGFSFTAKATHDQLSMHNLTVTTALMIMMIWPVGELSFQA